MPAGSGYDAGMDGAGGTAGARTGPGAADEAMVIRFPASEMLRLRVTPAELEAVAARADHARQVVAHLEAVGGTPGATP